MLDIIIEQLKNIASYLSEIVSEKPEPELNIQNKVSLTQTCTELLLDNSSDLSEEKVRAWAYRSFLMQNKNNRNNRNNRNNKDIAEQKSSALSYSFKI